MTLRLLVPLAAFVVLAAACAGSSDTAAEGVASLSGAGSSEVSADTQPEDDAANPGEAATQEEALLEFTSCMREHGVDIPDPTVDADGNLQLAFRAGAAPGDPSFDREAIQAARTECSSLLDGVTLGFGRADLTELQDTLFEYAACMRDNGYDMADPDFSAFGGGGGGGEGGPFVGPFGEIDPSDGAFVTADEACSDLLAGFGPGGGAGGTRIGAGGGGGGRPGGGGNGGGAG